MGCFSHLQTNTTAQCIWTDMKCYANLISPPTKEVAPWRTCGPRGRQLKEREYFADARGCLSLPSCLLCHFHFSSALATSNKSPTHSIGSNYKVQRLTSSENGCPLKTINNICHRLSQKHVVVSLVIF